MAVWLQDAAMVTAAHGGGIAELGLEHVSSVVKAEASPRSTQEPDGRVAAVSKPLTQGSPADAGHVFATAAVPFARNTQRRTIAVSGGAGIALLGGGGVEPPLFDGPNTSHSYTRWPAPTQLPNGTAAAAVTAAVAVAPSASTMRE